MPVLSRFPSLRRIGSIRDILATDHHKKLNSIARELQPSNSNFPWDKLKAHVDSFIKKQKELVGQENLDAFLSDFILQHSNPAVAIAACGHIISTSTAIRLLETLNEVPTDDIVSSRYLQALIAANHTNTDAVHDEDSRLALWLVKLLKNGHDPAKGHLFSSLMAVILEGVFTSSRLASSISTLFALEATKLNARINQSWEKGPYTITYQQAGLLRPALEPRNRPGCLNLDVLLSSSVSHWLSWAKWKPDLRTLKALDSNLDPVISSMLSTLISLEGPCLSDPTKPNAKSGLASLSSKTFEFMNLTFSLQSNDPQAISATLLLFRSCLFNVIAAAPSSRKELAQFINFMLSRQPITEDNLLLLEESLRSQLHLLKLKWQAIEAIDAKEVPPVIVICELFLAVGRSDAGHQFRGQIGPTLIRFAPDILRIMQNRLKELVERQLLHNSHGLEMMEKIHALGSEITASSGTHAFLRPDEIATLKQWPQIAEIRDYHSVLHEIQKRSPEPKLKLLVNKIYEHLFCRLASGRSLDPESLELLTCLLAAWTRGDQRNRELALLLAQPSPHLSPNFRAECIRQLNLLPLEFVLSLEEFIGSSKRSKTPQCIANFASAMIRCSTVHHCWKTLLLRRIDDFQNELYHWSLHNISIGEWIEWMEFLEVIFAEEISQSIDSSNFFLQTTLHRWAQEISSYHTTLEAIFMEIPQRSESLKMLFLRGSELGLEAELSRIFSYFGSYIGHDDSKYDGSVSSIMKEMILHLESDGSNSVIVASAMTLVTKASPNGTEACRHLLRKHNTEPPEVVSAYLECWHNDNALCETDHQALDMIAELLDINPIDGFIDSILGSAKQRIEDRFAELMAEAAKLEDMCVSFKSADLWQTKEILGAAGIEDVSLIDDLMVNVPLDLLALGTFEWVSDEEVELHISLDKLSNLKRKALGLGQASSLIVRLAPQLREIGLPGFCIHSDLDVNLYGDSTMHSPCLIFSDDEEPLPHNCFGKLSPAAYHLSRVLWRYLKDNGVTCLVKVHNFLVAEIVLLATKCIVCGVSHTGNRSLYRAAACETWNCKSVLNNAVLDIRLSDLWEDPDVVDVLLNMIYAASWTNRNTLLDGCPLADMNRLRQVIDSVPPIKELQDVSDNIGTFLQQLGQSTGFGDDIVALLIWVCTEYEGFLVSAIDNLKIPHLPGSYQFLLANAAPILESNFAGRANGQTSQIVFHGTGWDSLYPIMCKGLKIMSRTAYQAHGNSLGQGIYCSTNTAIASGYGGAPAAWKNSKFKNFYVILGCEMTGNWSTNSPDIYVVRDEACMMVRYLFFMPTGTNMPASNLITPAMTSIIAALKSGSL